jgi:hypothetical protein
MFVEFEKNFDNVLRNCLSGFAESEMAAEAVPADELLEIYGYPKPFEFERGAQKINK